jgi:hypothetical protein
LPARSAALLPQVDQALVRVEIPQAQGERATSTAGRFGMQPKQQRVQARIVTRAGRDFIDLRQPGVADRSARTRQPTWLVHLQRRVVTSLQVPICHRPPIQAPQRRDQMLRGRPAAPGVASCNGIGLDLRSQLLDLRRLWLVDAACGPGRHHPVPVRAVGTAGTRRHAGGHHRYVLGERRCARQPAVCAASCGSGVPERPSRGEPPRAPGRPAGFRTGDAPSTASSGRLVG